MRKLNHILAGLLVASGLSMSPTASDAQTWAKGLTGMASTDSTIGQGIVVDPSFNTYVAGRFRGTFDADPNAGTMNLASMGNYDVYFAKYNINGDVVWAKSFGGSGKEDVKYLSGDGMGGYYLLGDFSGTVDFDPGANVTTATSAGGTDIFLSKFDGNGNFLWVKTWGGAFPEEARSLYIDKMNGSLYVTGLFTSTIDSDPNAGVSPVSATVGITNSMVVKLTNGGTSYGAKVLVVTEIIS